MFLSDKINTDCRYRCTCESIVVVNKIYKIYCNLIAASEQLNYNIFYIT